jgi:hypothetical protein
MSEAARKSTTESESDAWPDGRDRWTFVQYPLRGMRMPRHRQRMTAARVFIYGPAVLEKQYDRTARKTARNFARKSETVPSY